MFLLLYLQEIDCYNIIYCKGRDCPTKCCVLLPWYIWVQVMKLDILLNNFIFLRNRYAAYLLFIFRSRISYYFSFIFRSRISYYFLFIFRSRISFYFLFIFRSRIYYCFLFIFSFAYISRLCPCLKPGLWKMALLFRMPLKLYNKRWKSGNFRLYSHSTTWRCCFYSFKIFC